MVDDSDVQGWGRDGLAENITEEFVSMATFENAVGERFMKVQCAVLEGVVQEAADKVDLVCPVCGRPLAVVDRRRERSVQSVFGRIRFARGYGYCTRCNDHFAPADYRLGLQNGERPRRAYRRSPPFPCCAPPPPRRPRTSSG